MKELEILQFKYNQHVNNYYKHLTSFRNKYKLPKHNMNKEKIAKEYRNGAKLFEFFIKKDEWLALENDYNNYLKWLVDGNKTWRTILC